jgi:hypothetical protein
MPRACSLVNPPRHRCCRRVTRTHALAACLDDGSEPVLRSELTPKPPFDMHHLQDAHVREPCLAALNHSTLAGASGVDLCDRRRCLRARSTMVSNSPMSWMSGTHKTAARLLTEQQDRYPPIANRSATACQLAFICRRDAAF